MGALDGSMSSNLEGREDSIQCKTRLRVCHEDVNDKKGGCGGIAYDLLEQTVPSCFGKTNLQTDKKAKPMALALNNREENPKKNQR